MLIKRIFLLTGAVAVLSGCKDEVDLPDQPLSNYINVYMPQAVNAPLNKTLVLADTAQHIVYGAAYGGQNYPDNDITVRFRLRPDLVDSFNAASKTNYPLLPANTYELSGLEAQIRKGQLNTIPMRISIRTKGDNAVEALKTYVLPIAIESASLKVNEKLRTAFFIIKAQPKLEEYPDWDRSLWTIAGFSSEEASGEGADNGHAKHSIDGNINSFWHSQWKGTSAVAPHYIIYDIGETKEVHGISFMARQNDGSGKPSAVTIETSLDNVTWEVAGVMELQNNKTLQRKFLDGFKQARYIKVNITSAFSASYSNLAELYAF